MASDAADALDIRGLEAWYGESKVLHGVDLQVRRGEVVSLLGRNGAGRTTVLRAILGLAVRRSGSIRVFGEETNAWPTHRIARQGLGYCPEERGIFASLTLQENLLLPPRVGDGPTLSLEELYALFPNLYERRHAQGTHLSGGEQQMLAVARILRSGASLLLLDEISEGLAPVIVEALSAAILTLKERGYTILMVEQNFHFAADLADRFYVVEYGRIVEHFPADELGARQTMLAELLSV